MRELGSDTVEGGHPVHRPRAPHECAPRADVPTQAGPPPTETAGPPAFPELLRAHRERVGITQRALADLSTVSARAIRDLEAGRANARTQTIHLLADGLGLRGPTREAFVGTGLASRRVPADDDPVPAPPEPVNALVGRDTEVRAMVEAFESGGRRMVCVTGLPGVGKTRVAAEVAARLGARCQWPVLWVDAGPPGAGTSGAGTSGGPLLRSLRALIESPAGDPAAVRRLIGRRELLIVLDGLADALPSGSRWVDLLACCPGLRVLSVARAPHPTPGVQPAVLQPLAVPGAELGPHPAPDAVLRVPSVRLLVDRLGEVRPGFTVGPADVAALIRLCGALDGLPLALELVVGWFRVLSLRQLAALSTSDLLTLPVPRPDGLPATLASLLGSAIAGLDERHRAMLGRLATVESGWRANEAAKFLRRPLDEVMAALSVLIGHGVVRATHGDPETVLTVPNLVRAVLRGSSTHSRGVVRKSARNETQFAPYIWEIGGDMGYNSAEALRAAGLIGGTMTPELENYFGSLTKSEVDVLVSTRNRLDAVLPDVAAHWDAPEMNEQNADAAMLCACGIWSGSGLGGGVH